MLHETEQTLYSSINEDIKERYLLHFIDLQCFGTLHMTLFLERVFHKVSRKCHAGYNIKFWSHCTKNVTYSRVRCSESDDGADKPSYSQEKRWKDRDSTLLRARHSSSIMYMMQCGDGEHNARDMKRRDYYHSRELDKRISRDIRSRHEMCEEASDLHEIGSMFGGDN